MVSGFSGDTVILCRQPCNQKVKLRSLTSLYKLKVDDSRWRRLITTCDLENETPVTIKVEAIIRHDPVPIYKIFLRNGKTVSCTEDQEFLTRRGFQPLKELKKSDQLGVCRNKLIWWTSILEVAPNDESEPVYQVQTLSEFNCYIANGLIVR